MFVPLVNGEFWSGMMWFTMKNTWSLSLMNAIAWCFVPTRSRGPENSEHLPPSMKVRMVCSFSLWCHIIGSLEDDIQARTIVCGSSGCFRIVRSCDWVPILSCHRLSFSDGELGEFCPAGKSACPCACGPFKLITWEKCRERPWCCLISTCDEVIAKLVPRAGRSLGDRVPTNWTRYFSTSCLRRHHAQFNQFQDFNSLFFRFSVVIKFSILYTYSSFPPLESSPI